MKTAWNRLILIIKVTGLAGWFRILTVVQTNKNSEGVIRKVAWGNVSNFFLVDKKMMWLYFPTCCISGADHMWPWPQALLFQEKCERYNQKEESK